MDGIVRLFGVFAAMGGAGVLIYAGVSFVTIWAKRQERIHLGSGATADELADLRARVAETEDLRSRVLELEERVDFTERLLAQHREPAALPERREP